MQRSAVLLLLLLIIGVGAYKLWPRHGGESQPGVTVNFDPRGLTGDEQAAFLPLVCGGVSGGADGYAHSCQSLPGYPSQDYGGAGTGLGITLTGVIYGHLTGDDADEAYVSYLGSFEPHATNFGGGILFHRQGNGWALSGWYPGGAMEHCLSLNSQGRARFLCLYGYTGQGETDTSLFLVSIPGGGSQINLSPVLKASDLRETMDPNANCGQRKSADQAVLLGIDSLARGGSFATAQVDYVPAAMADAACKAKNFASVSVQKASLALSWDGSSVGVSPDLHFAPAE